ncbi:MAG: hypothetical protein AB1679_12185 [Actinomycetota bacterium]
MSQTETTPLYADDDQSLQAERWRRRQREAGNSRTKVAANLFGATLTEDDVAEARAIKERGEQARLEREAAAREAAAQQSSPFVRLGHYADDITVHTMRLDRLEEFCKGLLARVAELEARLGTVSFTGSLYPEREPRDGLEAEEAS